MATFEESNLRFTFPDGAAAVKKKLSWLDCRVSVVDSDTYRKEIFSVQK